MHLENFFLVISQCLDQRNGKKPGEHDIFTFLLLWDSLMDKALCYIKPTQLYDTQGQTIL